MSAFVPGVLRLHQLSASVGASAEMSVPVITAPACSKQAPNGSAGMLVAMGYGGSLADAAQVIGKSGDGGIDTKEDKLGLDVVCV